jgi:hypothetical protein
MGCMTLHRLPRHLPPVPVLLADLEHPPGAELAASLGVSVRSVWRWQQLDHWPRPVHLALFFASRYGWSVIDSESRYAVQLARGLADALRAERDQLAAQLDQVQQLADTGAANLPVLRPGAVTARPRGAPLLPNPVAHGR